jgi:hypothetical protein
LDPHDDHAAGTFTAVSVGCDALWYYLDADLDGAGAEATRVYSCEPQPNRIVQGGDCDDKNPLANAAMPEICNSVDDNCDGNVDEGFTPVLLIEDADGDGFGSRGGMTKIGCPPEPGFATTFDDCDDLDPAINPGAVEIANLRDDDCNGRVDDLSSHAGSGAGSGATSPASPAPAPGGGCQVSPDAPGSASLFIASLLLALFRRSRGRGVRARA